MAAGCPHQNTGLHGSGARVHWGLPPSIPSPHKVRSPTLIYYATMSTLETQILKATDEALTADNWQYILDVCDTISSDPETNIRAAMKVIRTRLAKKDANIVLRTLTLVVAVGENCGSRMQQEIALTSFLKEFFLSKLGERRVHKDLKFRIAEVIEQLHKSFKNDPSLKAITDAYNTVRTKYSQYLKSAPDKPAKKELTAKDRQREDLELERALKLSTQEFEREQTIRKSYLDSKPLPAPNAEPAPQSGSQTPNEGPAAEQNDTVTIANVKKVCAMFDFISYEPDELSFKKGDVITVIESVYRDWWRGSLPSGKTGIFPLNYVTPVIAKTPEELLRELKMETALIETELKKVDRLLALLSSNPDQVSEASVTELYESVIPLKPILAQLIDKHSSRRDELKVLNDQANAQIKSYDQMIDGLIAQRRQPAQTYSLPYPDARSHAAYPPSEPRAHAAYPSNYTLQEQHTSAGFGNARPGAPPQNFFQPQQLGGAPMPPTSFPQGPNYA